MGLGDLLVSLGLGQSDLLNVTRHTLERIDREMPNADKPLKMAMGYALKIMSLQLIDEGVAKKETAQEMIGLIEKWESSS